MKLNLSFTITVETKRFEMGNGEDGGENTDLTLTMNELEAGLFLFKISANIFKYQDYNVFIRPDPTTYEIRSISFIKDNYTYIIRNQEVFFSDVLHGYEKLRMLDKLAAISEYADFSTVSDEIVDEDDL